MYEEGKQGLDEDRIIVQVHAVFWKCSGGGRDPFIVSHSDWEAPLKGIHCKAVFNYYIIIPFIDE